MYCGAASGHVAKLLTITSILNHLPFVRAPFVHCTQRCVLGLQRLFLAPSALNLELDC